MGILACENSEELSVEPEELSVEPEVMFVDDLAFILDDFGALQTSKLGYPRNGCHEYSVTVSVYFVEVETSFHHCCVNGVCTVGGLFEKTSKEFMDGTEEFTLLDSSSWTVDKYTVSLAEGDYTVGKNGDIKDMRYKVIIN